MLLFCSRRLAAFSWSALFHILLPGQLHSAELSARSVRRIAALRVSATVPVDNLSRCRRRRYSTPSDFRRWPGNHAAAAQNAPSSGDPRRNSRRASAEGKDANHGWIDHPRRDSHQHAALGQARQPLRTVGDGVDGVDGSDRLLGRLSEAETEIGGKEKHRPRREVQARRAGYAWLRPRLLPLETSA